MAWQKLDTGNETLPYKKWEIRKENNQLVCEVFRTDQEGEEQANLIAATPDMLAALENFVLGKAGAKYMATQAIAKARGLT